MQLRTFVFAMLAVGMAAVPAKAAIIVDGSYDADYGAAKSVVTYDPAAPTSNFGSPTPFTDAIGYQIFLKNENGYLYGLLTTSGPGSAVGSFANLYFGNAANGSTIGFEITNQNVFEPGGVGPFPLLYSYASTPTSVEFALSNSFFTDPIGATGIDAGFNPGDTIQLRLSQSFGYSVAGGALYGPDRLGSFTLSAAAPVPGPVVGAGLPGALLALGGLVAWRKRRRALAA